MSGSKDMPKSHQTVQHQVHRPAPMSPLRPDRILKTRAVRSSPNFSRTMPQTIQ